MKLSERKRKDLRPTPAGDCVYFWLDDIEELEKLETQFEAELKAVKNDYERIKQLEAELGAERSMRHEAQSDYGNQMERLEQLEAENERLVQRVVDDGLYETKLRLDVEAKNEALRKFVHWVHKDECASLLAGNKQCDCGYDALAEVSDD